MPSKNKHQKKPSRSINNREQKPENYVDLLDEDPPIAGQKFACVSFISPENILKKKELFYFEEFLKGWDLYNTINKFSEFNAFVSYKYGVDLTALSADFEEFILSEKNKIQSTKLVDDYHTFIDKNEERLQAEFDKDNNFQTSIRGFKIRGVFATQEETEFKCKSLRNQDPNHDIYLSPVGVWVPFHPDAYKTGRVEHLESELNNLMAEKNKNEQEAKEKFDARVKSAKREAIKHNVELAQQTNNKLSQIITENDTLVNVLKVSDENDIVDEKDVIDKLFSSDNVHTKTHTD